MGMPEPFLASFLPSRLSRPAKSTFLPQGRSIRSAKAHSLPAIHHQQLSAPSAPSPPHAAAGPKPLIPASTATTGRSPRIATRMTLLSISCMCSRYSDPPAFLQHGGCELGLFTRETVDGREK